MKAYHADVSPANGSNSAATPLTGQASAIAGVASSGVVLMVSSCAGGFSRAYPENRTRAYERPPPSGHRGVAAGIGDDAEGEHSIPEVRDEGDRGDGRGCGDGRDDAGRAARAAGGDQRRLRSGACVGVRPDRDVVALDLDRSRRPWPETVDPGARA